MVRRFLIDENDESESRDSCFDILRWGCGICNGVWNDCDQRSSTKFMIEPVIKINIVIIACEALVG